MVGPQHLVAVARLDGFKRSSTGMIRGEGVVILWVPILRQNRMAKGAGDAVDHRHHLLSAWYSEGASVTEVILYVNHQQNVAISNLHPHALSKLYRHRNSFAESDCSDGMRSHRSRDLLA
jgi:hypothetical protein